jgi:urease accessory protein
MGHGEGMDSEASQLAELRILQLADSALPIGALAHSLGLETLACAELLKVAELPEFLCSYLEEAGLLESVFCRESFALGRATNDTFAVERWRELNERLSALKPARESRAASAVLGQNLLQAICALGDFPVLRAALDSAKRFASGKRDAIHHCTVFGLAAGALALDEDRTILAYLHQSLAGLISACQRLLPLGQTHAMRILWDLKPVIVKTAGLSGACSAEDVCCFAPLVEWAAMEHPALGTRLFVS